MFLKDLRYSLLRRWYFVLAGLLLTAGLGLATLRLVPSTYEASASVVLLPPTTAVTDVGNPYLVLGGLSQAVDVLIHRASADAAQTPIATAYPRTAYTVQRDVTTSGPIITIVVDGPTPAETLDALKAVMTMVPAQLGELQDQLSVAAKSRIGLMTLSQDAKPATVDKARTRALLAVVAAGLVATLLLVGLLDGLMSGRRRRSVAGPEDGAQDEVDPGTTVAAPPSTPAAAPEQIRPSVVPAVGPPVAPSPSPARAATAAPARDSWVGPSTSTHAPIAADDSPSPTPRTSRIRLAPRHAEDEAGTQAAGWAADVDQPSNGTAPGTTRR